MPEHGSAPSGPASAGLAHTDLHRSLRDPVLASINFLNEVTGRFPDAISFGPGAPYDGFFEEIDLTRSVDRFAGYLATERGYSPQEIRRRLFQYGPTGGVINDLVGDALRAALDVDIPPRSLVITVGCQEAILITLRTLFAGSRDVLIAMRPCYAGLAGAARLLDIDIVTIDDPAEDTDWWALRTTCDHVRATGRRPRALYVIPDYSNPSGVRISLAARRRLVDLAADEELFIIEDNPYGFTAPDSDALPALKSLDRHHWVVHVGSFSKTLLPGTRVGYVIADQTVRSDGTQHYLADDLAAVKSVVSGNTSPICQAVIGGMLLEHGGRLASATQRKASFYRANLRLLLDALRRHLPPDGKPGTFRWNTPGGGFFLILHVPFVADDELLEVSARDYGVLWVPMSHFYGTGADTAMRLSCSDLSPPEIEAGVQRLARFLVDAAARRARDGKREGGSR